MNARAEIAACRPLYALRGAALMVLLILHCGLVLDCASQDFATYDEIGNLGRAFDQMADRIQTLLTAERRLLQDISHELRSPLARLSFATELVRTAEDREAAVARIRKEVTRLTSLVSSLAAGWLYDELHHYDLAFWLCAGAFLLAALCIVVTAQPDTEHQRLAQAGTLTR